MAAALGPITCPSRSARPRNRLNLTLTLPNCQVTKSLVPKLFSYQFVKLLNCWLPNCEGYQIICYQIVSSQNVSYQVISYQKFASF